MIAELRGKISRSGSNLHDRLEDLLTSDVFGGLLYAEAWEILSEWLAHATTAAGTPLGAEFPALARIRDAAMVFWPGGGCFQREPDVVLRLVTESDGVYGICVEAKYLSGKSGVGGAVEDPEALAPSAPGDQLTAQWLQIREPAPPASYRWEGIPPDRRALLFVTAHPFCPVQELNESIGQLNGEDEKSAAKRRCFWLGWSHLHSVLKSKFGPDVRAAVPDAGPRLLLFHLYELLERKGLRHFRGYGECVRDWSGSERAAGTRSFWNERYFAFLNGEEGFAISSPVFWREASD